MTNQFTNFFICFCCISIIKADPQVKVKEGILKGVNQVTVSGRNISAFLGVPYGKPPIKNLRFKSPEPAENWHGIRDASSYANPCIHTLFGLKTFGKEDCLYLDVYTPLLEFEENKLNKTLLPVMVYIFGGSFFFGSSDTYNGNYILDKDVLLVIFNYRLGIFGFLSTGDVEAPGNFGIKDQVLALKWIQENIRNFGGDPNRVTIFGVSSGAASVHLHALSNASNGLFHQYIMQSGTALSTFAYRDSGEIYQSVKKIAERVSCPISSTHELVDCLRRKNAKRLLNASNNVGFIVRVGEITWTPTNESISEDAFLTDNPENLMHQMKDLPFISGVVKDEGLFYMNALYSYNLIYLLTKNRLQELLIDEALYPLNKRQKLAPELKTYYLNRTQFPQDLDAYTTLFSDGYFIYPEVRMLERITPKMKNPNYLYSYGYRNSYSIFSLIFGDNGNYGIGHSDDLLNFFPIKYGPINTSTAKFNATDMKARKLMIDLWTSFATNGIPASDEMNAQWEPYNTYDNTHLKIGNIYNNKDPTATISNDFYKERMDMWKKYSP